MSGYLLKHHGKPATFVMDWTKGYLALGETVTADLGWCIWPSSRSGQELLVAEQNFTTSISWARFAGGVPGRFYMVSNRVRTTGERVLGRGIVIRIAPG